MLAALIAIAAGVFSSQYQFNPAVLAAADAAQLAAAGAATASLAGPLDPLLPENFRPLSDAEVFDSTTLADKIDGKAELYLESGFRRLVCRRYVSAAAPEDWFEAYEYEMTTPDAAFAVFSGQRRSESHDLAFTADGYAAENALFLHVGSKYLELVGASAGARLQADMSKLAEAWWKRESPRGATGPARDPLPRANQVAGTVQLHASGAFGFADFDNVYAADYEISGARVLVFASRRASAGKAADMARSYVESLVASGGNAVAIPELGPDARKIELLDLFEVVWTRGDRVIGIHEAENGDAAIAAARQVDASLRAEEGGP